MHLTDALGSLENRRFHPAAMSKRCLPVAFGLSEQRDRTWRGEEIEGTLLKSTTDGTIDNTTSIGQSSLP